MGGKTTKHVTGNDDLRGTQVTFLGTGDAFNAGANCHASYLVSSPSTRILLDCGSTTLLALKRAGVDINDLDAVFLSHLHGDHFAGLPFLIIAWLFDSPRQRPVTIVGPPGTEERVRLLYSTMYRDLAAKPLPFRLQFQEVQPGHAVQIGAVDLQPFRVPHQESEISLGLRMRIEDKTILYSGDTGWTEDLIAKSENTDLFICECCFFDTRVDFHLDYPRIAENASRFGCQRLVLTHLGKEVLARRHEIELELADERLVVDL